MELADYVRALRRWWLVSLAVAVLGAAAGWLVTSTATPEYETSTRLFVTAQTGATGGDLVQASTFAQSRVASYAELATSGAVLERVIADLGLQETPDDLAEQVTASAPDDSVLVDISVVASDPQQAAAIADATAAALSAVVDDLETPVGGGVSPVRLAQVQPAPVPTTATTPGTTLGAALGLLVGLLLGLGAAVLLDVADPRLRRAADVRASGLEVLGEVPRDPALRGHPVAFAHDASARSSQALHEVRLRVQRAAAAGSVRTVLVVGTQAGDGATTVALQLALSAAGSGAAVTLVDADLRHPAVAERLEARVPYGLTDVLDGSADVSQALRRSRGDLPGVVVAGPPPRVPSDALRSPGLRKALEELGAKADLVVVDTTPLEPFADATAVAEVVDAVVLVAARGTTRGRLARAERALRAADARVLGVVLTRMPVRGPDAVPVFSADGRRRRR
ncbi:Wzz/FepE/Etk N-terminal domain-containing protein [Quadrisphaera sp. KR29]|uniref:Wzz/FepE/Etk N-terminal domain-containing protein n=1 Tax=Quadrisphaera sp. KR29 TaxID=3461391 RepID=UPI0040443780